MTDMQDQILPTHHDLKVCRQSEMAREARSRRAKNIRHKGVMRRTGERGLVSPDRDDATPQRRADLSRHRRRACSLPQIQGKSLAEACSNA